MLRSIRIGLRLSLGFGLLALLIIVLGIFSTKQLTIMNSDTEQITGNWLPSIENLGTMNVAILRYRVLSVHQMIDTEPGTLAHTQAQLRDVHAEIDAHFKAYEKHVSEGKERQLFDQLLAAKGRYIDVTNQVGAAISSGDLLEAQRLLDDIQQPIADEVARHLLELTKINQEGAAHASAESAAAYTLAKKLVLIAIALALVITALLAWLITRSIVTPLDDAVKTTQTIASGNLTQQMRLTGNDEPAQLLAALALMQDSLRSAISQINNSSVQLASASEEMSSVSEESSRNLQRQNDEIQQAASAVTEMSAAVDEVARNASATAEASNDSSRLAHQGRDRVQHTVASLKTMTKEFAHTSERIVGLAEQSKDIGKVLDVIRAIAEQTNLLALNAAIEAARAGDAGRGFAVVADEVRALAHRTQVSTQEIEQMISKVQGGTQAAVDSMRVSVERAEETFSVAESAGQSLDEIYQRAGQISERNLLIASAAEEQAVAAREVDRNIVNISDLSTQSAAGAEQTRAATVELSRLAVDLNQLVNRFVV